MSVEYARLSGALLAHLEFAATDIERALPSIRKSDTELTALLRKRVATIREIVAAVETHSTACEALGAEAPVAVPIPAWPGIRT